MAPSLAINSEGIIFMTERFNHRVRVLASNEALARRIDELAATQHDTLLPNALPGGFEITICDVKSWASGAVS